MRDILSLRVERARIDPGELAVGKVRSEVAKIRTQVVRCDRDLDPVRTLGRHRDGQMRTMDGLVEATGLDWSRVFLAIDRLSRAGNISLQRTGRVQYQVRLIRENA